MYWTTTLSPHSGKSKFAGNAYPAMCPTMQSLVGILDPRATQCFPVCRDPRTLSTVDPRDLGVVYTAGCGKSGLQISLGEAELERRYREIFQSPKFPIF